MQPILKNSPITAEHFEKWLMTKDIAPYPVMFDTIPLIVQLAYLVEFFDEYPIMIIGCSKLYYSEKYEWRVSSDYGDYSSICETRTEALTSACIKAGEIFNELKK